MTNEKLKENDVVLFSDRLKLRKFIETDLNDFYEYAKVEGVGEPAGWKHHQNIDESRTILNNFIKGSEVFAIVLKDINKVIGSIGIHQYKMNNEKYNKKSVKELGYVIAKDYWNHGYATEAGRLIIEYCRDILKLDMLVCGHFDGNTKSQRVIEKLGFEKYEVLSKKTLVDNNPIQIHYYIKKFN